MLHLPGFVTFRKDRAYSAGGGIVIFVRRGLAYSEIDLAPGNTLDQEHWNKIVYEASRFDNAILMGDFNARNTSWNCNITDRNGSYFENSINSSRMKFAENLNFRVNPTYVWNHCKILKNSILNIKAPHLSDYLQPDSDISSTLDKITPPWAPTDPSYMPDCQRNDFLDSHFTFLEFNIALEQKNDRSAPGLDGISFEILKKLPINYKLLLLDLFNQMFSQSTFPDAWREAYVHFIRKAEGRGYRPISLTSCSCKLFETMLKGSLQWWAESGKWLPSSQHGFRKSNSCSDNLANLTVTIESAFKEGLEIYAAFVDIEGAFDKVNIDLLLKKLATKGASLRVVSFVKFATAERFIFTDSNKKDCTVAHKGITGNERVDALAKEGTGGPAGSNVFIPFTDTFELAKAQLYNSTLNKNLEDAPIKEKYYFDFMNSPLKTPWFNHKRPRLDACIAVCSFLTKCNVKV
ncbi:hypothetical protein TKK_0009548 [Trichogramma kaykai]